jgi:long-chain fatty acid transport protein
MGTNLRVVAASVALICATAWSLNKNQSVDFAQDLNRNASVGIDAVFHNPAGIAFLPANGLYLGGGNQTVLESRSIVEHSAALSAYGPSEYKGDIRAWAFPTLHAAYRMEDLTFFAHGGPYGGGGVGTFDQGLPKFDNMILGFASQLAALAGPGVKASVDTTYQRQLAAANIPGMHVTDSATQQGLVYKRDLSFKGDEMTLGGTVGAAYKLMPTLSVSGAYRFSYARNAYTGTAKVSQLGVVYQGSKGLPAAGISGQSIDSTINANAESVMKSYWKDVSVDVVQTGMAHSVVFGADFKPDDSWNVGLRFEWNGELELTNKTSTLVAPDDLIPFLKDFADGAKSKITEPMILAGGVSFKGVQNLTLESSWTYGFYEQVDRGGAESGYRNSLFGGAGARYKVVPELELAVGYAHDWAFRNDAARLETDFDQPTNFLTLGADYQASPRLRIKAGSMFGLRQDVHGVGVTGAPQDMSADMMVFGVGLEWSPAM